jgi:hypothetical protein
VGLGGREAVAGGVAAGRRAARGRAGGRSAGGEHGLGGMGQASTLNEVDPGI